MEKSRESAIQILEMSKEQEQKGLELHRKSIVFDSLLGQDTLPISEKIAKKANEIFDRGTQSDDFDRLLLIDQMILDEMRDPSRAREIREEYVEGWRTSGVTCASLTMPPIGNYTLSDITKAVSIFNLKIENVGDPLIKAVCADDVKRAKKEGKHAILYSAQNIPQCIYGINVENELDHFDTLFGLGIRVLQLTYNFRNVVGDGSTERYKSGLSHFGVRVVERMNKIGMLIDASHCGYKTTLDAVEVSKDPIAETHITCRANYDHPRGKSDEELKSVADKDGYVGITTVPRFLGGKGTIKEWLDHIDYAVDLIGVDHVGIGTDREHGLKPQNTYEKFHSSKSVTDLTGQKWWVGFWPIEKALPRKWSARSHSSLRWENWPYYTAGLVTRGYSDQEIKKIIGGNFLRILERVVG